MRLKSVELFGFKSFPDRTVIEFGEGITAILGPNGCGKSNVVDAIKWVLGEKSAKNLRGEEMLDVIFSGCETRSPSGMAEVKLNFDNTDQTLALPYNEVSVSRRLYRSKESEYFINQNRCRLKDIRDLFLDTGVGSSAYSVIEQGRVEALLHAKPADRRAVFEEAAGIAKFKVRRKEILSRLERTDQILLRVNDRIEDKDRQIRRVSTQAANARRHRRLTGDLESLKGFLYRRQFANQTAALNELNDKQRRLEEEIAREDGILAAAVTELAKLASEEAELTANRDAVHEAISRTQDELSKVQIDSGNAANRMNTLKSDIERRNERRSELTLRLERLKESKIELQANLESATSAHGELEEHFLAHDGQRRAILATAETAEREVTDLRNQVIDLNKLRHDLNASAARLEASGQSTMSRIAEIEARLSRLREEADQVRNAASLAELDYRKVADQFGVLADEAEQARTRLRSLNEERDAIQREERRLDSEVAAKRSRKATLEDLEHSLAGAFEGVRNVISAWRSGEASCRGVIGMALDLMRIPQEYAQAIETQLGGSAQDIVVDTAMDAQSAIEYLKRNRLGRATFLPLDRISPRRRLNQDFRHTPGVVGEAVDLVDFDSRYRAAMEYLLAGVLVVEDLDAARRLAAREARGIKLVTLEGDVINPSGAMTGGHGRQRTVGLVQRKAELTAVTEELAVCGEALAQQSKRREDISLTIRGVSDQIAALEKSMAETGKTEAGLRQNLAIRKNELERLEKTRSESASEKDSLVANAGSWREELTAIQNQLAETEGKMAALEAETIEKTEVQRNARAALENLNQSFAALSGDRATAAAKVHELKRRFAETCGEAEQCEQSLAGGGGSCVEMEAEIEVLFAQVAALREREEELLRVRDSHKAAGIELTERLTQLRNAMDSRRNSERDSQTQLARLREGISHLGRQLAECEVKIENIREKARLELGLEDLAPERPETPSRDSDAAFPDDESAVAEETASPSPESSPWSGFSDEELQRQAEGLTQKIRNIGPVNFDAIDELAELEASAEFLRSQQEDLESAVGDMRQTIDKLNLESSKRFQETFVTVRENFQQMFTRLFGGGKADLVLEELTDPEADPLDAGIDIHAQPPGKEPKSISLLSGGEKALCAVALLFALFRSKPSPFCILDEVDGPLDESNIDRFMQQVRDFTTDTQFIIITHSQRTMGMTDEIWGVTQQVAGISTIHSLRFNEFGAREEAEPEEEGVALSG